MKFLQFLSLVILAVSVIANNPAVKPGYTYDMADLVKGPGNWESLAPNCGVSTKQSPIDIEKMKVNCIYMAPLKFENDADALETQAASYVQDFKIAFKPQVKISEGGLTESFTPLLANLYWGTNDTDGTEHSLDGDKAAAELQIYAYGDTSNALHVFVVQYKVGAENAGLKAYLDSLSTYNPISMDVYAKASAVTSLASGFKSLLPANTRDFYRYNGTVTRPACMDATYTVLYEKAEISADQLALLRTIQYETAGSVFVNGAGRMRPVQSTSERDILATWGTNEAFLFGFLMDVVQWKGDIINSIFG